LTILLKKIKEKFWRLIPFRFHLKLKLIYMLLTGNYDKEMVLVSKLLTKKRRFIDIGANQGIYSLYFSSVFKLINTFEPVKEVTSLLQFTNKKNIQIHHVALTDSIGERIIEIPKKMNELLISRSSLSYCGAMPTIKRNINTLNLDHFCYEDVDLIKIDVEGHEDFVINGALETIKRCKPFLIIEIELRHRKKHIDYLVKLLENLHYKCFYCRNQKKLIPYKYFKPDVDQNIELFGKEIQSKCQYINNFIFIPK
tara:strand:+ start:1100 stop:1861 length:762 start_codon:yes stop_codon:yes gene_type:complete